jgi:AcrR family transcriptional regulator
MASVISWEDSVTTTSTRYVNARNAEGKTRDRRLARTPDETTTPQPSRGGSGIEHRTDGGHVVAPHGNGHGGGNATRRRVIEAGARVFADLGFHAATKERIGAAAGFSHQTVRDYFRTKEGLLAAIVCDAWRSVLQAMTARPEAAPIEQLLAGYDALDSLTRSRPAEARCVLHEAQIAGPKGAPLHVQEEIGFKRAVEQIITNASGIRGAAAATRSEILVAAMEALTRPNVVHSEGEIRIKYSSDDARQSFRMLAETMLQRVS